MKTVISFQNVSKRYNLGLSRTSLPSMVSQWMKSSRTPVASESPDKVLWALKDVSFDLYQGQSLALIGANGAGKTTILKLLANITRPTSGRATTNGKLSALIELGAGFHPDLTGRENIYLNGTILGLKRKDIQRRFDEIVEFSELERFIDTPVKRYSSGMTVRLGFAVASCIEPDILLVDEVLAVGDASFQQKCLTRIRSLLDEGTSVIFVSHNLYLIRAACDVALYMEKGQVKYQGSTKGAFDMYEQDVHLARARKFEQARTNTIAEEEPIEITRVDVGTREETSASTLYSSQLAQIRVHYNAYRALGKVQLQVFVFRSDGVTSCMMRTQLDEFDLIVDQGQGVITVELAPLQLVGGSYYVEAGFLNESDALLISTKIGRSDWFTVKGLALSYSESSVFEPNTRWSHTKGGTADGQAGAAEHLGRTVPETVV